MMEKGRSGGNVTKSYPKKEKAVRSKRRSFKGIAGRE